MKRKLNEMKRKEINKKAVGYFNPSAPWAIQNDDPLSCHGVKSVTKIVADIKPGRFHALCKLLNNSNGLDQLPTLGTIVVCSRSIVVCSSSFQFGHRSQSLAVVTPALASTGRPWGPPSLVLPQVGPDGALENT